MERWQSEVERAQHGDDAAFCELVRQFEHLAYGYAYSRLRDRQLAEDSVQEAFLEAYRGLAQLRAANAFPAWLRRIVHKQCDRLTRRARVETQALTPELDRERNEPTPLQAAEKREMRETVQRALNELPEHERAATVLFYIGEYTQREIAGFLEIPETTVNNRLSSARRHLKERMISMVKDTIREQAPDAEAKADQILFLLTFGKGLHSGVPILKVLEQTEQAVKTAPMREVARSIRTAITAGSSVVKPMNSSGNLFPPMVMALVSAGEQVGALDYALLAASTWLSTGSFVLHPTLFAPQMAHWLLCAARSQKATEVLVDTSRTMENGDPKAATVWTEYAFKDGSRRPATQAVWHGHVGQLTQDLMAHTQFDEQQTGNELRGTLRLNIRGSDQFNNVPISFRPLRKGQMIRISLGSV
ncbi:MAG: sigma-70 family RNA polymerase sigma factor [Planctomycetota bacterium]|nr:sigma-70 family RNA polymerase sigma factor [Planctomycetota bacterium]